jgi:putative phosphoesterase
MRIAIISDTHSRHGAVEKAVRLIDEARVELTIHCGDITDSETIWLFPPNTHFVWGNCDADRASLRQAIHGIGATCHEYDGRLELAGKRLGFTHGDDAELLDKLILSGELDFVLHGHTHRAGERTVLSTRVINPGAFERVRTPTFAVLDIASGVLEYVAVE